MKERSVDEETWTIAFAEAEPETARPRIPLVLHFSCSSMSGLSSEFCYIG